MRRELRSKGLDPKRLWLMVYPGFLSSMLAVLLPSIASMLGRRTADVLASGLIGMAIAAASTAALMLLLLEESRTPLLVRIRAGDATESD